MSSVIERTIRGGAGFFTANVVTKGFGFLFVIVASRFLGAAEFGILSLGMSVTGVARNFATFGLPTTVQRFLSGDGEDRSGQIYSVILLIGAGAAIISAVVLYALAPWLSIRVFNEANLITPLRILTVGVTVGVGATLLRSVLQAQEQVRRIVVLDTVRSLATILGALMIFIWMRSPAGAGIAVVSAYAITMVVAGRYVTRLEIRPAFDVSASDFRTVLTYSVHLVVVGFSYFLAQQSDRLMLGWLSDAQSVGVYTVSSTLAMVMSTLHGALVSIFMPLASKAHRENKSEEMQSAYLFVSKWVGLVNGIALIIFAAGGVWILGLFGAEYSSRATYHVLMILSALYFIGTWVGPTGALLQMTGGHRLELINTAAFIVANIGLNYLLISRFGILGAAIATFCSGVLRNLLQVVEIYVMHAFVTAAKSNIIIFVVTATSVLICLLLPSILISTLCALAAILALILYIVCSIPETEKAVILNLIPIGEAFTRRQP